MGKSSFIFTFIGLSDRDEGAIRVRVEEALDGIVMLDYGIHYLSQGDSFNLKFEEDLLTGRKFYPFR